jgi:conjugal transfer pilus assembly protein TraU
MLALVRTALLGLLLVAGAGQALAAAACQGKVFNPVTDTDWNNMFPVTIMGVRAGSGSNPPLMRMPPVCVCPGRFGVPTPGIGVTFWQPLYVSEIERTPGCLSSLGGVNVLPNYGMLGSEQNNDDNDTGSTVSRMQVHWYEYPAFAMLELFKSMTCFGPSGFNLSYLTEIDPTWQDDLWGAVFSPESALFANPVAQAACAVDAAAASVDFPLDALFWCAGTWGSVYPLTGNGAHTNSAFTLNNLVQAKFLARQARIGLQWQTIGPSATCFAHPNPVWVKSQYRYNQVGPIARRGKPVVTGSPGLAQSPPVANTPGRESTTNLIWQGQQCCMRF